MAIIKECSRCHGQGRLQIELDYYNREHRIYVQCSRCGAHGPLIRVPKTVLKGSKLEEARREAIAAWNNINFKRE